MELSRKPGIVKGHCGKMATVALRDATRNDPAQMLIVSKLGKPL